MRKVAIRKQVLEFIKKENFLKQGEHVLLALSGGGDSVALFRLLLDLQKDLDITISTGHFNHNLRGDNAQKDQEFVRELSQKYGVNCYLGQGDVKAFAKEKGFSIEEAGREMRYAWLAKQAQAIGAHHIVTAHHADDNIETVLLNFLRGAGTLGLAGIPPKRGNICRPLLCVTREQIESYLQEIGQDYRQDETNEDTSFRRNLLRQQVLPILKALNPSLGETALRSSMYLRQDANYLDIRAKEFLQPFLGNTIVLEVSALKALDPAICNRVLLQAAAHFQVCLGGQHIESLVALLDNGSPSAYLNLPKNLVARREYDKLLLAKTCQPAIEHLPTVGLQEGENELPQWGLRVFLETGKYDQSENFMKNGKLCFQKLGICGKIKFGPRKMGDSICLYGRTGTKTIKKWMIEMKIPAYKRDTWPILYDDLGPIALGQKGIAKRVYPNEKDEIYIVSWEEL